LVWNMSLFCRSKIHLLHFPIQLDTLLKMYVNDEHFGSLSFYFQTRIGLLSCIHCTHRGVLELFHDFVVSSFLHCLNLINMWETIDEHHPLWPLGLDYFHWLFWTISGECSYNIHQKWSKIINQNYLSPNVKGHSVHLLCLSHVKVL